MATIANLTVKSDDSFEGNLATLTVSAPIAIIPNNRKTKDSEPDYRIVSRKNSASPVARAWWYAGRLTKS